MAFLQQAAAKHARPVNTISPEAMALMQAHDFPGNMRELKNTLACALAFVDGCLLEPHHLPLRMMIPRGAKNLLVPGRGASAGGKSTSGERDIGGRPLWEL